MNYLKDYREGEKFVGTYLCKQKQILKTKAGKTYYSLTLQDKTGTADGKIWELNTMNEFSGKFADEHFPRPHQRRGRI